MPPAPSTPDTFPTIRSPLTPAEIVKRLETASRRGRMPGYQTGGPEGALFHTAAFGAYFDGSLLATAASEGTTTILKFAAPMKRFMPIVWGLVLIATVWPGVVLTDSFLANFQFARNWWPTWWWYMPLTVPFVPWTMWTSLKKSRDAIDASARETIPKIAAEIDGTVEGAAPPAAPSAGINP